VRTLLNLVHGNELRSVAFAFRSKTPWQCLAPAPSAWPRSRVVGGSSVFRSTRPVSRPLASDSRSTPTASLSTSAPSWSSHPGSRWRRGTAAEKRENAGEIAAHRQTLLGHEVGESG
jgi:hypothetical protein